MPRYVWFGHVRSTEIDPHTSITETNLRHAISLGRGRYVRTGGARAMASYRLY